MLASRDKPAVAILWDLDGEAIPPSTMTISKACESLRNFGLGLGEISTFKAYISPRPTELGDSAKLASDLRQNGVDLSLHLPTNPNGLVASKELVMISDLFVHVIDRADRASASVVVVTNEFATLGYSLDLLRNRQCDVIVLSTRDVQGQPPYVKPLDSVWSSQPRGSEPPRRLSGAQSVTSSEQRAVRPGSQARSYSGLAPVSSSSLYSTPPAPTNGGSRSERLIASLGEAVSASPAALGYTLPNPMITPPNASEPRRQSISGSQSMARPNSRYAPLQSPTSITATPTSPWSFSTNRSDAMPLPTPLAPDNRRDPPSPSISTQSTNIWLHGTEGGRMTAALEAGRLDGLNLPLSFGLDSDATGTYSDRTTRPEPHAWSFRPPAASPSVLRVGTALSQSRENSFASSFGIGNTSIQSAPSRYDPVANITTELRSFDSSQFQLPRLRPDSASSSRFAPLAPSSSTTGLPLHASFSSSSTATELGTHQQPYRPAPIQRSRSQNSDASGGLSMSPPDSPPSPSPARPSSSRSPINSGASPSSVAAVPMPMISFHPLMRILEKFRAEGNKEPLRSAVGSELRQNDPHIYDKLGGGIRTFKEYAGAAERAGLVILIRGEENTAGKERISLVK